MQGSPPVTTRTAPLPVQWRPLLPTYLVNRITPRTRCQRHISTLLKGTIMIPPGYNNGRSRTSSWTEPRCSNQTTPCSRGSDLATFITACAGPAISNLPHRTTQQHTLNGVATHLDNPRWQYTPKSLFVQRAMMNLLCVSLEGSGCQCYDVYEEQSPPTWGDYSSRFRERKFLSVSLLIHSFFGSIW